MKEVIFYALGAITLVSAFLVIFLRRPIHNVLFMITTMIGLAGLFLTLQAEFVAMVQLIVYAGAVMVLFLFVVTLLNLDEIQLPPDSSTIRWWIGAGFAIAVAVLIFPALVAFLPGAEPKSLTAGPTATVSNTAIIAKELFTTYLLPFEIASVLLLAAIIGSVVLVKKKY
jgi:NADH-quinone oxidoreductase subunit J